MRKENPRMGSVTNLLLGRQLAEQYARQEAVRVGLVGGVAVAGVVAGLFAAVLARDCRYCPLLAAVSGSAIARATLRRVLA
jgi:hypothetical protein